MSGLWVTSKFPQPLCSTFSLHTQRLGLTSGAILKYIGRDRISEYTLIPSCAIRLKTMKKFANRGFEKKNGNNSAFSEISIFHIKFEGWRHNSCRFELQISRF
jgi:hypothetical protein